MADVVFKGTLTGSDGSQWVINDARLTVAPTGPPGPSGPTGPSGPVPPSDVNTARAGAASYPLTAINPTSTAFPGGRGANQLVLYRDPVAVTVTNIYGAEATFSADRCVAVNDRQTTGATTGTKVPAGGYVLSGHGTARDWLLKNVTVGTPVTFAKVDNPTGPTGASGPSGPTGPAVTGTKTLAAYLMMWPGDGSMSDVPAECNEVRLAFAQGNPPSMVGWSTDGQQQLIVHLAAFRARGGRVLLSIGGAGGVASIGDHAGFLAGIAKIRSDLGGNVDGIDWDLESVSMNTTDAVALGTALKAAYGPNFRIVFTPNGSNVGQYLPAAVACHKAGCLDSYGQQFYDAPVAVADALWRLNEALGAGIPANKLTVGMMIASDASHWTNGQCVSNYVALKAAVPQLGGAYLWEVSRAGTAQWGTQVGALVFG